MRIQQPAGQAKEGQGHALKNAVMPATRSILTLNEAARFEVISRVFHHIFLAAPSQFEATEPLIVARGAAKSEFRELVFREPLDRLPHHEVHPSQFLVMMVRGAELVDGPGAEMEKDDPRYWSGSVICDTDEALVPCQQVVSDQFEKRIGLRRKAMLLSRLAMQGKICLQGRFRRTGFEG